MATSIPVPVGQIVGTDYLNEVARGHWRKTTTKTVNTTVTDTDLLNGEVTVDAGAMASNRAVRLTAWGDWKNNSGGTAAGPQFKVKLGASPTTVIDTGALPGSNSNGAARFGWRIVVEIFNLGATNSQSVSFKASVANGLSAAAASAFTTGEGGNAGSGAGSSGVYECVGFNTAAIDTTAAMALILSVINASANASYETKLYGALVEVI